MVEMGADASLWSSHIRVTIADRRMSFYTEIPDYAAVVLFMHGKAIKAAAIL